MKGTLCFLLLSSLTSALGQGQVQKANRELLPPPSLGFQPSINVNAPPAAEKSTPVGPDPLPNTANAGTQSGPPKTKPKEAVPSSIPVAQSTTANKNSLTPQVKSTFNNPPTQQSIPSNTLSNSNIQAFVPTAAQTSTANNAVSNPTSSTGTSPAANPEYSQWFGNNVPSEVSQLTPEQLSMMSERQAEHLFRVQFPPLQPTLNANKMPGTPQNTWTSGNSMGGANPLVGMMNQMLQRRINTRVLEAMNPQEAGIEIPPFAKKIVCNGIVPPAPGNETALKLATDGTMARANAMAQGLELKIMKGAILCHNKLAEYQACDITPNSDIRKMPCQPNTPNACQPGWSCSLYSGQMIPICCPKTVRQAVMIDEGIPGA
ncbi:POU domain, class 6, transcription factor 2-like isoform X2 [Saccostrea echinata]|uniref:POU domain, class 6, transcription factor 2-like isoform X2 n=1 Tax=Saccostrea echinata TaxID=191078 RepID=UPI002A7F35CC|nr:POU domain, class 6, transcription factor 2-like isoform X2 [Saccostrea echinata]